MVQVDLAAAVEQSQLSFVRPRRGESGPLARKKVHPPHGGCGVLMGDDVDQIRVSGKALGVGGVCERVDDRRDRLVGDPSYFRPNLLE